MLKLKLKLSFCAFVTRFLLLLGESSPVFDDPLFSRSKHWRVSTSHLTHEMLESWGFGEVVADGEWCKIAATEIEEEKGCKRFLESIFDF